MDVAPTVLTACAWYDLRKQWTANLESVEFAHIVIRPDRCELRDLIEGSIRPRCLRVVKNKAGHCAFAIRLVVEKPHAAPPGCRKVQASAPGLPFEIGKFSYFRWLGISPRARIATTRVI
jgi:hypothetical protein